jgi:uncharacterized protein YdeI (YjbR/CyaY-like superfamily)
MEITQTLYVTDPKEWRAWLEKHYKTERDIWLVYYKKHTGQPRISYNDAVEQALCFGWIDSIVRRLDDDRTAQRFSPRKPKSGFSQPNIERLRHLVSQGKVIDEVLESLGDILEQEFVFPPDIIEALRSDPQVWENYRKFSKPYKRIRVAFIEAARNRPAEFEKRLNFFIKMTRKDKQIGFGGIEKYY